MKRPAIKNNDNELLLITISSFVQTNRITDSYQFKFKQVPKNKS